MKKNIAQIATIVLVLMMLVLITTGQDCTLRTLISDKEPMLWGKEEINTAINKIIDWMVTGISSVAVIFLMLGGLKYIISFGNPEAAQTAKKTMTFAIIALLVVWSAWLVINLVLDFLRK